MMGDTYTAIFKDFPSHSQFIVVIDILTRRGFEIMDVPDAGPDASRIKCMPMVD